MTQLVLASTSPYRKALLDTLGLPFCQEAPGIDEAPAPEEPPDKRARRLARAKGEAVRNRLNLPHLVIIASDQVAHRDNRIFDKPGGFDHAREQLIACRGQWVSFTTAVCLLRDGAPADCRSESFQVKFRNLSDAEIHDYLRRDEPWDCAGSLKAESLGIALLEDSRGRDINALYGLPLMLLVDMLTPAGITVLSDFNK